MVTIIEPQSQPRPAGEASNTDPVVPVPVPVGIPDNETTPIASTSDGDTPPPEPTTSIPRETEDFTIVINVPFSGSIRRTVGQVPEVFINRTKRFALALLAVFLMGILALLMRVTGKILYVVLRVLAAATGWWLVKLVVFLVIAFGPCTRHNPRHNFRGAARAGVGVVRHFFDPGQTGARGRFR